MLAWITWGAMLCVGVGTLQAAFEVTGALPASWPDGPVVLSRESLESREATPVTTQRLVGGKFKIATGAEPGLFTVTIGEADVSFVAGDGQTLRVSALGEERKLRVEGGPDQAAYLAYEAAREESLGRLVLPVRAAGAKSRADGDEAAAEQLAEKEVVAYRDHRRELNDFSLAKLRGSAALYAASLRWDGDYRLDELATMVEEYARAHPGAEIARLMKERIARFRIVAIGALAPELSGPSPDGGMVSLTSLRGRHVLVDFWASWCAPCRIENRSYVELYSKYQAAGFEILAVSVDQDGRGWRTAIAKDKATWRHISDLSAWKSPLAARYNVTALPSNFLLDPEGRVVAKDVRGKQLADVLAARLGAKPAKK